MWLRWWWWRSYGDCGGYSVIKGGSCKSLRSAIVMVVLVVVVLDVVLVTAFTRVLVGL